MRPRSDTRKRLGCMGKPACVHERAAADGIGDAEEHARAAARHREAADAGRQAALWDDTSADADE